ncbi:AMP-binding protein [Roseateles sp. BYS180W]|uniref:AMP-binding protein n=1 Tax=Roseateles rivi TaxID=3299028 RepID=A0ABW7FYR1_9BURK
MSTPEAERDSAKPGVHIAGSAHIDTFAAQNLPPLQQWPELRFDLPELQFPQHLNCAAELLDRWVAQGQGERPCVMGFSADGKHELRWSYAQLQAKVDAIAHVLVQDLGVVPGNRVLLRGANTPQLAACWLAVMKVGAIAVSTMPLLRATELVRIIDKAQISHALCDSRLAQELVLARSQRPLLRELCHFNSKGEAGLEQRAARYLGQPFEAVRTAAQDIALIAFTSGTTGVPKGTMHAHRDVMAICRCWPPHCLRATAQDVFIGSPPLAFTFGLGGLLLFPLSVGASTVLLEKTSPPDLEAAIAHWRATICFTAPTSYRAMTIEREVRAQSAQGAKAQPDLSSLRKCVSAGEALPAATRARWKALTGLELIDGIGATEMLHIFISHDEANARPGATGKPIPGYQACILDDDGEPVPPGQLGRLAVKGPTGCRYLADERQGQYVIKGWNVTGDAYVQDPDGYFIYQARTDDMIISGGYNIAGPEVESALLLHPAVAECGVVGVPDDERGQLVKAVVVLKPGVTASAERARELQDFVKAAIAPYKYPRLIEFADSLPRTDTGKLQRFRLSQSR